VRTIAGVAQLLTRERWLLAPTHRLWLQATSHKLSRLAAPYLLIVAALSSALLARRSPWYSAAVAAQIVFYGAAVVGARLRGRRSRVARLLSLPYAFCLLNVTTVIALTKFAMGRQSVQWSKSEQTPTTAV
jgi:hypothetical protein